MSDAGLATFLEYLTTFPLPMGVTASMARGPFAHMGARACDLWIPVGATEIMLLSHDGPEVGKKLYRRVSLAINAPVTESFINSSIVILPLAEVLDTYPSLGVDREYWNDLIDTYGNGDLIHVPIFSEGNPLGVYTILCDKPNVWTPERYSRLTGVAAAIALWMTNPSSGAMAFDAGNHSDGLWLTPRQMEILAQVRDGRSNAAIGARLGYSESTVKQELHRITNRLRVRTRSDAVKWAEELNLLPASGTD